MPLPPVFARSAAAERRLSRRSFSEGVILNLPHQRRELRLGKPHLAWQISVTNSPFHQPKIHEIQSFLYRCSYYCSPALFLVARGADDHKIEFCITRCICIASQTVNPTNSFSRNGFSSRSEEQDVHDQRQAGDAGFQSHRQNKHHERRCVGHDE